MMWWDRRERERERALIVDKSVSVWARLIHGGSFEVNGVRPGINLALYLFHVKDIPSLGLMPRGILYFRFRRTDEKSPFVSVLLLSSEVLQTSET